MYEKAKKTFQKKGGFSLVELILSIFLLILLVMVVLAFMKVIPFTVPLITLGVFVGLFLIFILFIIISSR